MSVLIYFVVYDDIKGSVDTEEKQIGYAYGLHDVVVSLIKGVLLKINDLFLSRSSELVLFVMKLNCSSFELKPIR